MTRITWRTATVAAFAGLTTVTGLTACGSSTAPSSAPSDSASASSSFVAATSQTIVGRWVPSPLQSYKDGASPFLSLSADGKWTGSDGCNGQGGTWTLTTGGDFHATSGPSTLIGCDGKPVGAWMVGASRAGFNGPTLVLLDASAKELGRLAKS